MTITSRLTTRSMENVSVELYLGEGASGASCTASHNSSWTFNPKNLVHLSIRLSLACYSRHCTDTTMGDEEPSSIFQLYATRDVHIDVNVFPSFLKSSNFWLFVVFSAKYPRPSRAFNIRFDILQHTFSALKIDQLRLTGETYKPYKGMRGKSDGDIEWRW